MLPSPHNTSLALAIRPEEERPGLELVLPELARGGAESGLRLAEHTLGGLVEVADLEAVLRPIDEAAGEYARMPGPARDLAWEKCQWCLAVEAEIERGRTEAEAVQAVAIRPCDRWPHLVEAGKEGGDQRCLPNFRRWRRTLGRDGRGKIRAQNWGALAKRRGGGQVSELDREFMRTFFQLYLHPNAPDIEPTRRHVARLWRLRGAAAAVPSADQVRRAVAKVVTPPLEMKYRSTRNAFANLVKGWIHREVNAEPGEMWFMDHRVCDFWVRTTNAGGQEVAVRPYITAVFDARSFVCVKAIIYVDSNPNHERILECWQEAVRRAGNRTPRLLYIDNGKDFLKFGLGTDIQLTEKQSKGRVLCDSEGKPWQYSVMRALGVTVHTARGYNGKEKPIERWFRDMAGDWEKTRLGYCGNSPATRPDFGETWQGDVRRLETVAQAMASFDAWIAEEANRQPREDGLTRGEMWRRRPLDARPVFGDVDLFVRMLLPQRVAPLVRRTSMGGGVAFAGWQYSHADLREHWGQPVLLKTCWSAPRVERPIQGRNGTRRREVPAAIFVFTLDDRLICGAIADPVFDMFAESAEEMARIGAAQHLINAVCARDRETFRELTGRQTVADPSRVLAELDAAADEAGATVAISADPSAPTRRLPGAGKGAAEPVQELCFEAATGERRELRGVFEAVVFASEKTATDGDDAARVMAAMEW